MADLFCGAGGTSTGLVQAAREYGLRLTLLAINHWEVAIATHARNHPDAQHICESLDSIDPRKAVPGGHLDLLIAAPECTHHSVARGGRPIHDQSRATAWHVLRWCEALRVDEVLVENVPEFTTWGPLGSRGRPLKSRKGETFDAWVRALRSLNYTVDWRVLNAADYGDATTRRRLFIRARRGRRKITWPAQTHAPRKAADVLGLRPWRPAREIIDWSIESQSIFRRRKPLAQATLRRIEAGIRRFVHPAAAEPFLLVLRNNMDAQSLQEPLPTITANGTHIGLVEPFVLGQQSGATPRSVDRPLPTISTAGAISLIEPFLVGFYSNGGSQVNSVSEPLPTVTTRDRFGLVELRTSEGRSVWVDILFRMLEPHELAAAMGFEGYQFEGSRTEQIRQIGNAVPVQTARALITEILAGRFGTAEAAA